MKHSITNRRELTVLKIEEEVFDFRHRDDFTQIVDSLLQQEESKNLLIDFSPVKAIDSAGIGAILQAHQLANRNAGLAVFVALCKQIKDLLKLTNLDKQLYIFSSINEVMTLVEPNAKPKKNNRAKSAAPVDEIDELLGDDLDIIGAPELGDEKLAGVIDDELHVDDSEEEHDKPEMDDDADEDDDEHVEEEKAPAPKEPKAAKAKKEPKPKKESKTPPKPAASKAPAKTTTKAPAKAPEKTTKRAQPKKRVEKESE
uniref:Anti-anti-sigma factor, putative n=1 Tax=Chlorobium chlorochromatii (strain CaD3) TaxID=340177 RepID=Q3AQS2_CHLCH